MNILSVRLLVIALTAITSLILLGVVVWMLRAARRRASTLGYTSVRGYLRAIPQSDAEVRDSVDLALMGAVLCILGIAMPPIALIGLVPLYYGARKVIYTSMGLGLVDDGNARGT